uniref:histidine protein methyltransferase 1 homolog n=1 Tax=Ciona intestinalis TaxID=7719 RepID=UPI00089DCA82|nr:histidine protein methyltransferase 1 homolog [Ciona intestinalis]|eukprot:XP_018672944.1 histidine protein methyltransferase 1 homolog [Ciona intestinalis]
MEVGCGFGLPGILAVKCGAKKVVFQDYNHFVIFNATGPSVFLNECKTKVSDDATPEPKRLKTEDDNDVMDSFEKFLETDIKTECQYSFISGDWGEVAQNVDIKFETILTAETIYDVANYENLHGLLETCLHQNGCVILAAKSFYFGVGGGIELWREFVKKKNIFRTDVAEVVEASVRREILKMTFIDAKPSKNKDKVNE